MRTPLLAALTALTLAAPAAAHQARPVALSDARVAPDMLRLLAPGQHLTELRQCPRGGYYGDTSAYRWNGRALPAQTWNRLHDRTRWGRVSYDGLTWHNRYPFPVLVAGWCG